VSCSEFRAVLHPYLDGELDPVRQVEIEDHLHACGACAEIHRAQLALRSALKSDELYFKAPAHLELQVRRAMRTAEGKRAPLLTRHRMGVAAAAAAVVFAAFFGSLLSHTPVTERVAQDVISAHIRSLMPGHLTDVLSSEQHTVKPWFAGKLDFSPPVANLGGEGFELVGGRLDYAAGRPVAALVYRRGAHLVNLFVWPSASAADSAERVDGRHGYNLVHWTRAETSFWAISDLNATELRQFAELVRSAAGR
jgi:anti-sigma factor RsiW